jgi:hypothetical protein
MAVLKRAFSAVRGWITAARMQLDEPAPIGRHGARSERAVSRRTTALVIVCSVLFVGSVSAIAYGKTRIGSPAALAGAPVAPAPTVTPPAGSVTGHASQTAAAGTATDEPFAVVPTTSVAPKTTGAPTPDATAAVTGSDPAPLSEGELQAAQSAGLMRSGPAAASTWLVGDSLVFGMSQVWPTEVHVAAALGAGAQGVVPALIGMWSSPRTAPPLLVVSLGTNDNYEQVDVFRVRVQQLLNATNGCVVWTTIHRDHGQWDSLNNVLRAAASVDPRLRLADWGAWVDQHPSDVSADGVHPQDSSGYRDMARLVEAAAATCP